LTVVDRVSRARAERGYNQALRPEIALIIDRRMDALFLAVMTRTVIRWETCP